jgi:CheY-like chemotaxis protein
MNVLFVEDNEGDILLIQEAMEEYKGIVAHIIKDGRDAIDFLTRNGANASKPPPDIIFLDINLPRLNGHEILKFIRSNENLLAVPVIIFTTSSWPDDLYIAYQNGANCYITKPTGAFEFIHALTKSLDFWTKVAKLPH